jgi:hypothetical protein
LDRLWKETYIGGRIRACCRDEFKYIGIKQPRKKKIIMVS